jgi:SAM-dependent methyltransferase
MKNDFWAKKETGKWWLRQDSLYRKTGEYESSENLIKEHAKKFKNILEIGNGSGRLISLVGGTALDINPYLVNYVNKKYKNVQAFCGSVYDMPFKDKEFDLVFTYQVLQHVEDITQALKEMKRVCMGELLLMEGWQEGRKQGELIDSNKNGSKSYMHYIDEIIECYKVIPITPIRKKHNILRGIKGYFIKL